MFRVTQKFDPRGQESLVKNFNDEKTAKAEIQKKLADDARMKVKAIYCLYEGYDLLEQFDQSKLAAPPVVSSAANQESSGGKGSTQSFRPSPLQTSPRPGGIPPSSWKRDDENEKDK